MAELPEIEIARRDLDKDVGGRKIKAVDVPGAKRVVDTAATKKAFGAALEGRKIASVRRAGLHLVFDVGEEEVMVADLGSAGRFLRATAKTDVDRDTQVVITFTQGGQLRLLDTAAKSPSASDATFFEGVNRVHAGSEFFKTVQKVKKQPSEAFIISHYAGDVYYGRERGSWLERENDRVGDGSYY